MFFDHVKAYTPFNAEDAADLKRLTAFIKMEKDNLFSRTNLKGHITASAWVVNEDFTKALLVHHKKLGMWLQPGGHADGSADILAMAKKEVFEETGLKNLKNGQESIFDISVHEIPELLKGGVVEPSHFHYDIRYLLIAHEHDALSVSDESHDVRWFGLDEAVEQTAGLGQMVEKTKQRSKHANGRT